MKNKISLFFLLVIMFLASANLVISNRLSTAGEKIKNLEMEIKKLDLEDSSLELEIARAGSISGIIKKAEDLGFTPSPKVFYLPAETPVAMK